MNRLESPRFSRIAGARICTASVADASLITLITLAALAGDATAQQPGESLPYNSGFEIAGGFVPGNLDGQGGWSVDQGEADVEIGAGVGGTNGLVIRASEPFGQVSLHLARPESDVVFSDFHVKPVAVDADPAAGGGEGRRSSPIR